MKRRMISKHLHTAKGESLITKVAYIWKLRQDLKSPDSLCRLYAEMAWSGPLPVERKYPLMDLESDEGLGEAMGEVFNTAIRSALLAHVEELEHEKKEDI